MGVMAMLVIRAYGQTKVGFEPVFRESKATTHDIKKDQRYTFGYLEVPENRQDPESATIRIPVYRFKSRSPNPKMDPIIYTVGGPGYSTMPSAPYMNYYQYLDDRDFILLEQRGNYYAQPHLACPEWAEAMALSPGHLGDSGVRDSLLERAAVACRQRLRAEGIDLDGYRTTEIAEDIHDLVIALGIEEYNLLTISYSTKIAQVLLREHPERIRSVVMDSPLPLEVQYDEESVGNLLEVFGRLLSDCELQEDCRGAFPDLKNRFFAFLTDKSLEPLALDVRHPLSGDSITFHLRGSDLIGVFSEASTGDVADIPFEANRLLMGDWTMVRAALEQLLQGPGDGSGIGMRLSVWCAEEAPFNDPERVERETTGHPEVLGLSPATYSADICAIWGVRPAGNREDHPVSSDIPVLFINGTYDELTPAKWAEVMMTRFENGHHLLFPGWKHTPTTHWGNPCAMQAANDFFNNPESKPQPRCLTGLEIPLFKTLDD